MELAPEVFQQAVDAIYRRSQCEVARFVLTPSQLAAYERMLADMRAMEPFRQFTAHSYWRRTMWRRQLLRRAWR